MTREKIKHQIFISSLYKELRAERDAVIRALLEFDCIPSAMEFFPAADEGPWTHIKRAIDESDYYILILGEQYGVVRLNGMSYTEMEYRYAVKQGKPTLVFVRENSGGLSGNTAGQTDEEKEKNRAFRELVRQRLYKTWTTPDNLALAVCGSLAQLRQKSPAGGCWVRSENALTPQESVEILPMSDEPIVAERVVDHVIDAQSGSNGLNAGDKAGLIILGMCAGVLVYNLLTSGINGKPRV